MCHLERPLKKKGTENHLLCIFETRKTQQQQMVPHGSTVHLTSDNDSFNLLNLEPPCEAY